MTDPNAKPNAQLTMSADREDDIREYAKRSRMSDAGSCLAEIDALRAAIAALQGKLDDIADREAAVCPEDVPFDEVIRSLARSADKYREQLTARDAEVARLTQERDEAREFGEKAANAHNALLLDRRTICVYCGHEYEGDTPDHAQLTAHISTCSKHPMAACREALAVAREALEKMRPCPICGVRKEDHHEYCSVGSALARIDSLGGGK